MAYCTKCGTGLPDHASFCPGCGAAVATPGPQSPRTESAAVVRGTSAEQRKELLRQHLHYVTSMGARVESQGDYSAHVVEGHRVNHLLHFFIGLFTCGAWWLVWLLLAMFGGEKRTSITVDEHGDVSYVGALKSPHTKAGKLQTWAAS